MLILYVQRSMPSRLTSFFTLF